MVADPANGIIATDPPRGRPDSRVAKLEPAEREVVTWAGVPAYERPAAVGLRVPTGRRPGERGAGRFRCSL